MSHSVSSVQQILRFAALTSCSDVSFRFIESGGVYKLAFGPKAFVVVSDPVVVRHLLKASELHI